MSYKGRDFAVGTAEGDTFVDSSGEVRDPVFKVVVGDLHHVFFFINALERKKRKKKEKKDSHPTHVE